MTIDAHAAARLRRITVALVFLAAASIASCAPMRAGTRGSDEPVAVVAASVRHLRAGITRDSRAAAGLDLVIGYEILPAAPGEARTENRARATEAARLAGARAASSDETVHCGPEVPPDDCRIEADALLVFSEPLITGDRAKIQVVETISFPAAPRHPKMLWQSSELTLTRSGGVWVVVDETMLWIS